jgi:hypothetical protein
MIRVILVSPTVRLREWLVCGLPTERVVKALLMMEMVEVVMLKGPLDARQGAGSFVSFHVHDFFLFILLDSCE